jgi:hypothetical protein
MAPVVKGAHRGIPKKPDSFLRCVCKGCTSQAVSSASKACHLFRQPRKRHQTHLQGRPSKTLTSSRSTVRITPYALENPSCPGVGRSKRRDRARGRSQLGVSSNRGRLPASLVVSFVRIGKSSAQARWSIPTVRSRALRRIRTVTGSLSQIVVRKLRAALVCPSSASGSDGLAEQAPATSWQPPCFHPAFFPAAPHLHRG